MPAVEVVIFDCEGVGTLCGDASWSITQSALPAVSPLVASNKNLLTPVDAALMVNVIAPDVVVPVVETVTLAVPAVAMLVEGTTAVIEVALTKEVVSAAPFQLITDVLVKFVPEAVRVKEAPPAVAADGDTEVNVGAFMVLL